MKIYRNDLQATIQQGLLSDAQAKQLWTFLAGRQRDTGKRRRYLLIQLGFSLHRYNTGQVDGQATIPALTQA